MKQNTEDILIRALELREQGLPPEQVYAAFPDAEPELREMFALAETLRSEAGRIEAPSPEVLRSALRRAAVAEEQGHRTTSATPGLFGRVPQFLRIVAPAVAVALVIFFADRSPLIAPGPAAVDQNDVPSRAVLMEDATPPGADTASQPFIAATPAEPPAAGAPSSDAVIFAAPQDDSGLAARSETGNSAATMSMTAAEGSPLELAGRIAAFHVQSAEVEAALLADTSEADSCGELAALWAEQDAEASRLRRQADDAAEMNFGEAEAALTGESEAKRTALAAFRSEAAAAAAERRAAADAATTDFRTDVRSSPDCIVSSASKEVYIESLAAASSDFEARILEAKSDLAVVLDK